jgi:hypothetical protein
MQVIEVRARTTVAFLLSMCWKFYNKPPVKPRDEAARRLTKGRRGSCSQIVSTLPAALYAGFLLPMTKIDPLLWLQSVAVAKRELPPLSLLRQASLPSSAAAAASRAPEIAATFQRHGGDHACGGQGLAAAHAATVDGLPRLPMRVPYMLPEDLPPEHQEEHMHIWGAPGEQTMPFPMRLLFYFSHATFFSSG